MMSNDLNVLVKIIFITEVTVCLLWNRDLRLKKE